MRSGVRSSETWQVNLGTLTHIIGYILLTEGVPKEKAILPKSMNAPGAHVEQTENEEGADCQPGVENGGHRVQAGGRESPEQHGVASHKSPGGNSYEQ